MPLLNAPRHSWTETAEVYSLLIHNSKDRCTFYSDNNKVLWGSTPRDVLATKTVQLVTFFSTLCLKTSDTLRPKTRFNLFKLAVILIHKVAECRVGWPSLIPGSQRQAQAVLDRSLLELQSNAKSHQSILQPLEFWNIYCFAWKGQM